MKNKLNKLKYFKEELNLEPGDDDQTKDLSPPVSPSSKEPEQTYIPDPNLISTVNGRKLTVVYDQAKDMLFLQPDGASEGIKLHGQNIDKLIQVIQKKRGEQ